MARATRRKKERDAARILAALGYRLATDSRPLGGGRVAGAAPSGECLAVGPAAAAGAPCGSDSSPPGAPAEVDNESNDESETL